MEGAPKQYTNEEIAEMEKSRTMSDAELLKRGAEYHLNKNNEIDNLIVNGLTIDKQIKSLDIEEGLNNWLNSLSIIVYGTDKPINLIRLRDIMKNHDCIQISVGGGTVFCATCSWKNRESNNIFWTSLSGEEKKFLNVLMTGSTM